VELTMNVKLLVVHGRPQGKCLLFPRGEYVFGRGAECHIRPNSDWVSRQHCLLRVTGEALYIRDLGSRNGTLVNGVRIVGERRLAHGDQIVVGPLVFAVHLEDEAEVREPQAPPPSCDETGIHAQDTDEMTALHDAALCQGSTEAKLPGLLPPADAGRRPAVS
jgi:pSer/pThr/pTyr-binding forkhead associated (FHA) protein